MKDSSFGVGCLKKFNSHASWSRPKIYVPSQSVKGDVKIFTSSCSFLLVCFYDRILKEDPSGLEHKMALSLLGIYRY